MRTLGVLALSTALTTALPALAADYRLDHIMAVDTDLVAALDADDPQATAFIAGVMGAALVRGMQGDPMLWWVQVCVARTFAGPEQIEPGIRALAAARPEDARTAALAVNTVLNALAGYCGEQMDLPDVALPE